MFRIQKEAHFLEESLNSLQKLTLNRLCRTFNMSFLKLCSKFKIFF